MEKRRASDSFNLTHQNKTVKWLLKNCFHVSFNLVIKLTTGCEINK